MIRRIAALLALAALITLGLAAPATAATASRTGAQSFLVVSNDVSDSATPVVIANGVIHAKGTDRTLSNTRDRFVFPRGAIIIVHHPSSSHQSFDPVTCLGQFTERGTYRVTGGSGAYDDAQGFGTYVVHVTFVGCDQNAPPEVFQLVINAHGTLTV